MGFVDDNEAEVFDWGEESRAGADDDARSFGEEKVFPEEMALGFGLFAVKKGDDVTESLGEDLDELRSEGDFWDEKDDRLVFF